MTQALLLIFLIWAVLLVPLGVRRRQEHPQRTVDGFGHAMDVLASDRDSVDAPAARNVARRVSALQHRRLQLFNAAIRSVVVAAVAAVIFGGWTWLMLTVAVTLTGTYAAVLRHAKRQRDYAQMVVRDLGAMSDGSERNSRSEGTRSSTVRLRSYGVQ